MIRNFREKGEQLGRERIANRANAYVYGNVMALSALTATAHPGDIKSGHALGVLLATGLMTLLAHGLADHVGNVVRHGDAKAREHLRQEFLEEARDSVPIATSAGLPALFLLFGMLGWVSEIVAMNLAIRMTMVRFLLLGSAVGWIGKQKKTPLSVLWFGIVFALLAAAIAVGKTMLTH